MYIRFKELVLDKLKIKTKLKTTLAFLKGRIFICLLNILLGNLLILIFKIYNLYIYLIFC